jgi:hypothetical protein
MDSYIWKYKDKNGEATRKLVDMDETELQRIYEHSKSMLYNNSKVNPGRCIVLNDINNQITNCSVELAIRWFCKLTNEEGNPVYTRFTLLNELKVLVEKYKESFDSSHVFVLGNFYKGLPTELMPVSAELVMKGCRDTLGKFNRSLLTKAFIIRQGIWFTNAEFLEFKEVEKLKTIKEILATIKNRFNLNDIYKLELKSSGLNYEQFRSLLNLKVDKKYSELTTIQLETLKNKILFVLEESVIFQINEWKKRMAQIEEVAESKQFRL